VKLNKDEKYKDIIKVNLNIMSYWKTPKKRKDSKKHWKRI
jgi:hypothetical protein